jgi:hypothetical protein
MNSGQFKSFQESLGLNNRELAEKLMRDPAAISRWRSGEREIPQYISKLMEGLMNEMTVAIPLDVLFSLSSVAAKRNTSVRALIVHAIKAAAQAALDGADGDAPKGAQPKAP